MVLEKDQMASRIQEVAVLASTFPCYCLVKPPTINQSTAKGLLPTPHHIKRQGTELISTNTNA